MKIPYRFTLFGNEWRVRWAHPGKGMVGRTEATRKRGQRPIRSITMHPALRKDRVEMWRTFAHEILHALWLEMWVHRDVPGWAKEPMPHKTVEKYEIPFASFLEENLSPCCAHCSRKQKSVSQR